MTNTLTSINMTAHEKLDAIERLEKRMVKYAKQGNATRCKSVCNDLIEFYNDIRSIDESRY